MAGTRGWYCWWSWSCDRRWSCDRGEIPEPTRHSAKGSTVTQQQYLLSRSMSLSLSLFSFHSYPLSPSSLLHTHTHTPQGHVTQFISVLHEKEKSLLICLTKKLHIFSTLTCFFTAPKKKLTGNLLPPCVSFRYDTHVLPSQYT